MKLFNLILLTIILLIQSNELRADYCPTAIHYMILEADLVVYGEIENMDSNYFYLKIKGEAFGDYNGVNIKVKKYKDWKCAQRWTKYEVGQIVFLFLTRDKNNEWQIMSGGGEGELPVTDGNIYLSSYYSNDMPFVYFDRIDTAGFSHRYKFQTYEIYGAHYSGIKFELNQFIDAVSGLRTCFLLTKGKYKINDKIKLMCTVEELSSYKNKSKLHNWLTEKCIK